MAPLSTHHTTDATFEADVLQASGPVWVDFWVTWCGPCKLVSKLLEAASVAYEGGELKSTTAGSITKAQLMALMDSQL